MAPWSLKVFPAGDSEVPRQLFQARLAHRYEGWDDDLDRRFDPHSISFVLYDSAQTEPAAVCRLILREWRGQIWPLPMELGDICAFTPPSSDLAPCEASGLAFTSRAAAEELARGIARWTQAHGVSHVYALFDPAHAALRAFYVEGAAMRVLSGVQVAWSSFRRRDTGQPVRWHVVVGDAQIDGSRLLAEERNAAQGR